MYSAIERNKIKSIKNLVIMSIFLFIVYILLNFTIKIFGNYKWYEILF